MDNQKIYPQAMILDVKDKSIPIKMLTKAPKPRVLR